MLRRLLDARRLLLVLAASLAVVALGAHVLLAKEQPLQTQSVGATGAITWAPAPVLAFALVGVMACLVVGLQWVPGRRK